MNIKIFNAAQFSKNCLTKNEKKEIIIIKKKIIIKNYN